MLSTKPFRFMSHLQLLDLHSNSFFGQPPNRAKGVPRQVTGETTCTKGSIGLRFSKEELFRIAVLPAAADAELQQKIRIFSH
jgi:hypothetical protein